MSAESKQVKRLQNQIKLLAECLADERRWRKQAYKYYEKRLNSKFFSFYDLICSSLKDLTDWK